MQVRLTTEADLERVMEIYHGAQAFMAAHASSAASSHGGGSSMPPDAPEPSKPPASAGENEKPRSSRIFFVQASRSPQTVRPTVTFTRKMS